MQIDTVLTYLTLTYGQKCIDQMPNLKVTFLGQYKHTRSAFAKKKSQRDKQIVL